MSTRRANRRIRRSNCTFEWATINYGYVVSLGAAAAIWDAAGSVLCRFPVRTSNSSRSSCGTPAMPYIDMSTRSRPGMEFGASLTCSLCTCLQWVTYPWDCAHVHGQAGGEVSVVCVIDTAKRAHPSNSITLPLMCHSNQDKIKTIQASCARVCLCGRCNPSGVARVACIGKVGVHVWRTHSQGKNNNIHSHDSHSPVLAPLSFAWNKSRIGNV